jgi:hypothetical protein
MEEFTSLHGIFCYQVHTILEDYEMAILLNWSSFLALISYQNDIMWKQIYKLKYKYNMETTIEKEIPLNIKWNKRSF